MVALLLAAMLPSGSALYEVDVASGQVELLVATASSGQNRAGSPMYSHDGDRIAFDSTIDNRWDEGRLFIWSRDGRDLVDLGHGNHATWVPGDEAVIGAVRRVPGNTLVVFPVDGGEPRPLGKMSYKPMLDPTSRILLTQSTRVPPKPETVLLTDLSDVDFGGSFEPQLPSATFEYDSPIAEYLSLPYLGPASAALFAKDEAVATVLAVTQGEDIAPALRQYVVTRTLGDPSIHADSRVILDFPGGVSKIRVPAISADGRRVAMVTHVGGREEIRVMTIDAPASLRVVVRTQPGVGIGSIAINGDGSRIAFVSNNFYKQTEDGTLYDEDDLEVIVE